MSLFDIGVFLGMYGEKATVCLNSGDAGYGRQFWVDLRDQHGMELTFHMATEAQGLILAAALQQCGVRMVPGIDDRQPAKVNASDAIQSEACAIAQDAAESEHDTLT